MKQSTRRLLSFYLCLYGIAFCWMMTQYVEIEAATTDWYFAQVAAGSNNGTSCGNAFAYNDATNGWNAAAKQGPDVVTHICGTITIPINTTGLLVSVSGTSGHPYTIKFETGAILQSQHFPSSMGGAAAGAIAMGTGKSFITVDGNNLGGTIQNTATGTNQANKTYSTGVSGQNCDNCIVQNLNINNIFVNIRGTAQIIDGNGNTGDNSGAIAIGVQGPHVTISGNKMRDCGWCVNTNVVPTDVQYDWFNNEVSNFGHAFSFSTTNPGTSSVKLNFHDNYMHDTINWDGFIPPAAFPGSCPAHQDGLHSFGAGGTSTMGDFFIYNNKFSGDWGFCPSGYIYIESSKPANVYMFNNVGIGADGRVENPNGWWGIFSGQGSGVAKVYNNTIQLGATTVLANDNYGNTVATNSSGNLCWGIKTPAVVTFENNTQGLCGSNLLYQKQSGGGDLFDYNFYGPAGGNAWLADFGSGYQFIGSFVTWKSASGGDSHGLQNNTTNLNSDGSPGPSFPGIKFAANLGAQASGGLTALANDTSAGNTRSPVARPATATCTTQGVLPCWDIGAFQVTTAGSPPGTPPSLTATVSGSSIALSWGASSGTVTSYSVKRGTVSGGPYTTIATTTSTTYTDSNLTAGTYFYVVSASNTSGSSGNSPQASGTIQPIVSIPGAPATLTATTSGSSVVLSWAASVGTPTNYIVRRGTVSGGPYTTIATLGVVTSYTDTGLANGTYFYVVAASNSAGTSSNSPQASAVVATAPALSLNTSLLSFSNTAIGSTSGAQTVTFSSTGSATLVLAASSCITISGPNAADFAITSAPACPSSFAPGNGSSIQVTFTPSTAAAESASLVIVSNDPSSPDTVSLSGTGVPPVIVSPSSINFGNIFVNKTSSTQLVTFQNNSPATVTFSSIVLTTGTQFHIVSNTCGGSVATGASCQIGVTFAPTSAATFTDTLTFTDSAATSPQTVALTGRGKRHGVLKVGAAVSWPSVPGGAEIKLAVWRRPWSKQEFFWFAKL